MVAWTAIGRRRYSPGGYGPLACRGDLLCADDVNRVGSGEAGRCGTPAGSSLVGSAINDRVTDTDRVYLG